MKLFQLLYDSNTGQIIAQKKVKFNEKTTTLNEQKIHAVLYNKQKKINV